MSERVTKNRYKYFAVIQDSSKPPHSETVIFINRSGRTDPDTGFIEQPICKGIEPNGNGFYVIDTAGDFAKEKEAALSRVVAKGIAPVIGPFDTIESAIIAEREKRPKTKDEQLVLAKQENAELRKKLATREDSKRV